MFPGSWCDVVDNTSVAITYLDEALNGANLMQRPKAIKLEFTSLQQKKALDLLDLPNRKNVVGCKWIFKYKRYTDSTTQGTISCSRVGIDNGKGFAPLARYNSIRSFLQSPLTLIWKFITWIPIIIFTILLEFLMFYQIFLSPQVKRCAIITYKHRIYELPHEFPNKLRLRILGK